MKSFKSLAILSLCFLLTFSQTAFGFQFFETVLADAPSSQKKLVAIFVDQDIYGSIKGDLDRYTNSYIPKQTMDIQPLVIPITVGGFQAHDLQRILENLYLEGEKAKNTKLAGVMLFGNIPLPVLELNGKRQQSIYPFVDFVDPMFVYDETKDIFVFNDHPESVAEIWHSVIPGNDPVVFTKFFEKLKKYSADPEQYAKAKIWIDDFPLLKSSYTEQERNDYINTLLFAEYDSYRRVNQAYNSVLDKDNKDELVRVVETAKDEISQFQSEKSEAGEHPIVDDIASKQFGASLSLVDRFNPTELVANLQDSSKKPMPTLILEKVIGTHFRPVHKLFGAQYIETMQKNPLAGGRYNIEDVDSSLEKIQLQDMVTKQYLKDSNSFLEELLDHEIQKNKWPLKYPLPVLHQKWESLKLPELCSQEIPEKVDGKLLVDLYGPRPGTLPTGPFQGSVFVDPLYIPIGPSEFLTRYLKAEYQNFYFGKNALVTTGYHQLSPYRGSWLNSKESLDQQPSSIRGKLDDIPYDINKFSAGVGLGWLAQQTKMLRGFNFDLIYPDLDLYDQTKCDDDQKHKEWTLSYRGGGSPLNIDAKTMESDPTDVRLDPAYSSTKQMRNPLYASSAVTIQQRIENRNLDSRVHIGVGRKQFDPAGAVYQETEITKQQLHILAQKLFSRVTRIYMSTRDEHLWMTPLELEQKFVNNLPRIHCQPRQELDDYPILTSFDEVEYFRVYDTEQAKAKEKLTITVRPQLKDIDASQHEQGITDKPLNFMPLSDISSGAGQGGFSLFSTVRAQEIANCIALNAVNNDDIDNDTLTNQEDSDMDGDGKEDEFDTDIDGDCILNVSDGDMDGDGLENNRDADMDGDRRGNREDDDIDADTILNAQDDDIDGDSQKNYQDDDIDGDMMKNEEDIDIDGDGLSNDQDSDIDGDGLSNDQDSDIDGDGILNGQDIDIDGDTVVSDLDADIDGDGISNDQDDDIDADGQKNEDDGDIDSDGLVNTGDQFPYGWRSTQQPNLTAFDAAGDGNTLLATGDICNGNLSDVDGDGIFNKDDRDVDGDRLANAIDPDIDGDGIMNREDPDMDCDGLENDVDDDIDCDGQKNGVDKDNDCDGRKNGSDGNCGSCKKGSTQERDKDNDGIPDSQDPDVDGDGLHNGYDDLENDTDGDGIPDEQDPDIDGDGIPNADDTDIDGDQIGNWKKGDGNCNSCKGRCKKCGKQQDTDEDDDSDGILDIEDPNFGGRDTSLMNIEERKNSCGVGEGRTGDVSGERYRRRRYYDYQIIDTVVQHKSPEVPHLDTGNVLTMERAIDDPRYTTFHGIGGDQVEFIYPNLFKVPIYEGCSLQSEEDMRQQVVDFLIKKAQQYNKVLGEQLQKSPSHYATHPAAFDFIGAVDISATPNRSYDLLPEDFFVQKLGELQIKRIATSLYYLSLPRKEKRMGGGTVDEYITDARKKFDLNTKFEYTMDEYLNLEHEKKEPEYKHDSIAYPTKIEKDFAYEVGLIVSDGQDKIIEKKPEFQKAPTQVTPTPTDVGHTNHQAYITNEAQVLEEFSLCDISPDGSVPLLKRPKALQCRWKETVKKPVSFKVIIDYDIGDVKNQLENWFDEAKTDVNDLGGKTSYHKSGWTRFLLSFLPTVSAQSSSQRYSEYLRGVEDLQKTNSAKLSKIEKTQLGNMQASLSIGFDASSVGVGSDGTKLFFGSQEEVGPLKVSFRSVGDTCLLLAGKNLCDQTVSYTFNPFSEPQSYPITLADKVAGISLLIAYICQGSLCRYDTQTIVTQANQATTIDITIPTTKILPGGVLPATISLHDSYGNSIDMIDSPLVVSVEGGTFSDGSTTKTMQSLQDIAFILKQQGSAKVMRLTARIGDDGIQQSQDIQIVQGTLSAQVDNLPGPVKYRLPQKDHGRFLASNNGKLIYDESLLPTIHITFKDASGQPLQAPITVRSRKGFLSFGTLQDRNGGQSFVHTDTFVVTTGDVDIRMLPGSKAGKDEIILSTPGLPDTTIPVEILASGPDQIDMQLEGSRAVGSNTAIRVTLKDSWGNLYTEPTTVELVSYGGLDFAQDSVLVTSGTILLTGTIQKSGGSCGGGGRCKKSSASAGIQKSGSSEGDGGSTNGNASNGPGDATNNPGGDGVGGTDQENPGKDENDIGGENGTNPGDGAGNGQDSGGGGNTNQASNNDSAQCAGVDSQQLTELPVGFEQAGYTTANISFKAQELLWPAQRKPDDLNIMYLNLRGGPWGDDEAVKNMLGNSKTLAITTMTNALGGSIPQVIASVIQTDGSIQDPQHIVDSLGFLGGELTIFLGTEGSIGSVSLGKLESYTLMQQKDTKGSNDGSIEYTAVSSVPGITQNVLFKNALMINEKKVIDFNVASIDTSIKIIPLAEVTDQWKVMMNGLHIGSIRIIPSKLSLISLHQVTLKDANYLSSIGPGGGGTNSNNAILIQKTAKEGAPDEVAIFPSIEVGSDPVMNVGFRHNFKNITNFSQGAMVGEATKPFANPFMINYGDPFLTRISQNRKVKETSFDEGIGRVVRSDTQTMIDVESVDVDSNGHKDIIITYRDGTIRILKSYGGKDPYDDIGELIVPADGVKETFVGDTDGDGLPDIMVYTTSDKLRVYKNLGGKFDVDGNIVCLDIPNGDKNVAQVRQLLVDDMDGNGSLDIITNDINNTIKVFYGGNNGGAANYISTDGFICDNNWKPRVQSAMQVIKKFSISLGGPIKDGSLLHRPGLEMPSDPGEEQQYVGADNDGPAPGINPDFDIEGKSKDEIKQFVDDISNKAVDISQSINKADVADKNKNNLQYMEAAPSHLKADKDKDNEIYAVVHAYDPVENPGFEVSKQFTDLNGGDLEKGDEVEVSVSLMPRSSAGPVEYWEQLAGPWIIYKTEGGKIVDFNYGNIPETTTIDWNVSNGYEFRIDALPLGGTVNFSYKVQYDGNGFVHIDIETNLPGMYRNSTNRSIFGTLFETVQAGAWVKKLRAYPDDSCYKQYREFSPGEKIVPLKPWLDEKTKAFQDTFDDRRVEKENIARQPDLSAYKKVMSIFSGMVHNRYEERKQDVIEGRVPSLSTNINLDIGTQYLERFADEMERDVGQKVAQGVEGTFDRINKSLNWKQAADYEFTYEKCQGVRFGKKSCGYQAFPFNMAFLSPGTYNVFGCKPKVPVIPKFFPDDAGLPILAIPTSNIPFIRPPMPQGAGGIFGGNASQFRMYISPTLTNGLGLALCFGPYKVGMKMKSPIGDVVGNCLVIAGPLPGPQCQDEKDTQEQKVEDKEVEANPVILPEQYDLAKMGSCDKKAQTSQPFISPDLGGQIEVGGRPQAIQATFIEADQTYLKGGNTFSLQIEGGNVKGLLQCIVRKRYDKQIRYVINNFTHMGVYMTLPDMDQITKDIENFRLMNENEDLALSNTKTTLKDTQEPTSDKTFKDPVDWKKKVSIPKSTLYNANQAFENPFEKVANLLDAIPLVSVYEKTVPIEIPWLYREDLNQYEQYLKARYARNQEIVNQYGQAYKNGGNLNVTTDAQAALTMVRKNLQTIQEYKEFPSKLYQLVHIYDTYVTEVIDFVNDLTTKLTGWLQVNANRYSSYVDTLILMRGIIQSWQVLIDLSVNRQTKCGKCRQDNYDFYSCKLSLLCVDLPILPIPPFKLPDIYIDLSRIKLGLDITLPKFAFVPKKVPTLRIPDLPEARDLELGLDIHIPEIPELPRPPKLPDLPKLTLDVDIELPTLPPAPKIPNIVPSIKGVIKLADFIGTIRCTIKGGIGLVAEQGVKTRIEQMTQRKMNIDPFDSLKVTFPDSPIEGYDYRLDATVDLKFDFQGLYDIFDSIASLWNDTLDRKVYSPVEEKMKQSSEWLNNLGGEGENKFEEILPKSGKFQSELQVSSMDTGNTMSIQEGKSALQSALAFILHDERYNSYHDQVTSIQSILQQPLFVSPATKEVSDMLSKANNYLGRRQVSYREQATMIRDRDRFLDTITGVVLVSDNDPKEAVIFAAPLFKTNENIKQLLQRQQSPIKSYLELNKILVDGFHHALTTKTASELQVSPLQYQSQNTLFEELKKNLDGVLGISVPENTSVVGEHRPVDRALLAQQGGGEAPSATDVDFSQYIEGFFIPGKDSNFHNVIADHDIAKDITKKATYSIDDVNSDGEQDILTRTENAISLKYGNQNDLHGGGGSYASVEIGPFASMEALITAVKDSDGRYRVGGGDYKLYEPSSSLYSFKRYGHNYETVSFARNHDFSIPGYVIALTDTPGSQREKLPQSSRKEAIQFIIAIPKDTAVKDVNIEIPGYLPVGLLQTYINEGKILRVVDFDGGVNQVNMRLDNIPRKWNYARIASLKYEIKNPGVLGGIFGTKESSVLKKQSAWSLQFVAGTQKRGDDQPPSVDAQLIRVINAEKKDEGFELKGNINTTYNIIADRTDNGKVVKSWIERSGKVIKLEDGPHIELNDLEYKFPTEEEFLYVGLDQAGNRGQEKIKLHIGVPEITIDEIRYQGAMSEIQSRLSDTIDKGKVQFERQRNGTREPMNPDQFPVKPLDPLVIGSPYPLDNNIVIKDASGNKRCSCNTKNCKIIPEPGVIIKGSCNGGGKLKLEIIDTSSGANTLLYTIQPVAERLIGQNPIQLLQGGYSLQTLNDESAGPYRFGTCVRKNGGDCVMYIDMVGNVYVPIEYENSISADYAFDDSTESVIMTYRDSSGGPFVTINTKIKPFE